MWSNLTFVLRNPQYRSLLLLFMINSLLFTFWLIRIPLIKQSLDLSEAELGMVLFFGPMGSLGDMFSANWITGLLGEGRTAIYSMGIAALASIGPVIAPTVPWLCLSLVVMGFAGATMNVAMNAGVTLLERRDQVRFMITCHGGWSLGGLMGSFTTSLLMGAEVSPWLHWGILAGAIATWTLLQAWPQLSSIKLAGKRGPALVMPTRPVVGLASIGICVMIAEGAAADWSGIYLAEVVHASPYVVGMGYASFAFFMTLGRFYGDTLASRWGGLKIIRVGTALGVAGIALVLIPWVPSVLLGFGCMGLGLSCVVPVLFSRSGQVPGLSPSMGIASVASMGYLGFLAGPVVIGFLAEELGIGLAFASLLLLVGTAYFISPKAMSLAS
ncbi:MAG: MFS transporter [Bacteroidota bacterium]